MKKLKQISALIAVIMWFALILATLIAAFIDNSTARSLFQGLIFIDIGFPVVIYAMMMVYRILSGLNKKDN